ncbi:ATP-binding cassette domain-containing protein [Frankia sp. QA3]|uniref:branched-chain amino acid ABC transporter ATP-binding protein/permease n=1 Tax=Frankia sp. QA3 TaxID=710111 RepID=UPI000269BF7E|nr:ATP-binding cassette domain-containing protein [Frankia sp. QA3]EIV92863.1 ABC-type branched-chain amino acid transport system, ATPase component [Frankia sp. QA3]
MRLVSPPGAVGRSTAVAMVAVVAVTLLPLGLTSYWLFLATSGVIAAFTALSIGVVSGRAGLISLCQLSFAAIGAWAVAWLSMHHPDLPVLVLVLAGGAAAVPFGLLAGLPALRLRGVNIAIVTLGCASVVDTLLNRYGIPGVDDGIIVTRSGVFGDDLYYFWLCWGLLLAVVVGLALLGARPTGAAWLAVRRSERSAAAMGLSVPRAKLTAFAAAAFVAGLGGALLVVQLGLAANQSFGSFPSLVAFTVAVMFGARFPEGAMFAGAATVLMPELLRRVDVPADVGSMLFAVGTVFALRQGSGVAEALRARASRRRADAALGRSAAISGEPAPVALPVAVPVAVPVEATRPGARRAAAGSARPGPADALEVRDLTVRYGSVVALDAVSFTVPADRVIGLIGPNGAGKSTLVDAVSGFLPGHTGDVRLGGRSVTGLSAAKRARTGIRRTFQQGLAVPELTVGQYLRLAAGRALPRAEVRALLEFVGGPPSDLVIADIDVGTRRLVDVAAGLAARPRVLLLDEPAAGLPADTSELLAARIAEIPVRFGCGVLLIEHDMTMVQAACSDAVVLDFGKVIAAGPVEEVLAHADVVSAYLGGQQLGGGAEAGGPGGQQVVAV